MVERTPLLIEITRDAPCEGRRDDLLRLAFERGAAGSGGARGPAAIRRHAAACPRCRAFLATARVGTRLAREALDEIDEAHGPAGAGAPDLTRTREFDRWLDGELAARTEREIALAMARTAQWLLRCDAEIAARIVTAYEEDDGATGRLPPADAYVRGLEQRLRMRAPLPTTSAKSAAARSDQDERLLDMLRKTATADATNKDARLRLGRALLERGQEITRGGLALGWLTQSHYEWFGRGSSAVRACLDRGLACEASGELRAALLQNFAVTFADLGASASALAFLVRGLECQPSGVVRAMLLGSRLIWLAGLGNTWRVERTLRLITRDCAQAIIRRQYAPASLCAKIQAFASRTGASEDRVSAASKLCVEVLHGE